MFRVVSGIQANGVICQKLAKKNKKEGMVTGSYLSIAKIGGLAGYLLSAVLVSFFGIEMLFVFYGLVILITMVFSAKYFIAKIIE